MPVAHEQARFPTPEAGARAGLNLRKEFVTFAH